MDGAMAEDARSHPTMITGGCHPRSDAPMLDDGRDRNPAQRDRATARPRDATGRCRDSKRREFGRRYSR